MDIPYDRRDLQKHFLWYIHMHVCFSKRQKMTAILFGPAQHNSGITYCRHCRHSRTQTLIVSYFSTTIRGRSRRMNKDEHLNRNCCGQLCFEAKKRRQDTFSTRSVSGLFHNTCWRWTGNQKWCIQLDKFKATHYNNFSKEFSNCILGAIIVTLKSSDSLLKDYEKKYNNSILLLMNNQPNIFNLNIVYNHEHRNWKSHWKVPPHWNTSETTLKSFTRDNHSDIFSL